jgi:alpha/beta hydrolase family protein
MRVDHVKGTGTWLPSMAHRGGIIALRVPCPVGRPGVARRRTLGGEDGGLAALEAAPAGPVPVRGVAVLLPGFTGSKEDFIALLRPMAAAGYRVICYDQRGQYESAGPDRERAYSTALFAGDLREVIGAVGNGGPAALAALPARAHPAGRPGGDVPGVVTRARPRRRARLHAGPGSCHCWRK